MQMDLKCQKLLQAARTEINEHPDGDAMVNPDNKSEARDSQLEGRSVSQGKTLVLPSKQELISICDRGLYLTCEYAEEKLTKIERGDLLQDDMCANDAPILVEED